MSNGNEDKWISVDKRTKKLVIRFWVKGYPKQFYIASGLPDSNRNRATVSARRDAISTDIELGRFDSSLDSYRFHERKKPPKTEIIATNDIPLIEIWEKFISYQESQLAETTIQNTYQQIKRFLLKIPDMKVSDAVKIRDYLLTTKSIAVTWNHLNYFSQACEWGAKSKIIAFNPFLELRIKKPKPKKKQNAFTLDQRDLIIKAYENDPKHSRDANLIKLLFFTGCRPGEAFALTWGDISEDCRKIYINKSCNFKGIKKSTKNGKDRVFAVTQGSKLHQLLLEMQVNKGKENELIFKSPSGKKMTTSLLQKSWRCEGSVDGIVLKLSKEGKVPYLRIYSTRHTFATWAIAQGITTDRVARWIGDEVATVLKYYVHPETTDGECPDF